MKFNFLKYSVEFLVIVSGVSASFLVDEYRESLRNDEERLKVLYNLKIELDEITNYCKERKKFFKRDSKIINYLIDDKNIYLDSVKLISGTPFEVGIALIDYRAFSPPMNRYNSIISEGSLKFVKSDSIKDLLSTLNNTIYSYVVGNVEDEKIIKERLSSYISTQYPEIIVYGDEHNFNDYYKNLKKSIEGDMQFKAQLKLKSRTMFVKEFFLDRYIKTLNNLKGKIEKTLNEG